MKTHFPLLLFIFLTIIAVSSCKTSKKELVNDALASHIDSAIKAGDDFFLFANGKWFRQNPIPSNEQSNGIFQLVQDTINSQVRHICELSAAIKDPLIGSNKQKIGDFFFTGMDSIALNKNGISDLKTISI
jgi:putative endopeptidase